MSDDIKPVFKQQVGSNTIVEVKPVAWRWHDGGRWMYSDIPYKEDFIYDLHQLYDQATVESLRSKVKEMENKKREDGSMLQKQLREINKLYNNVSKLECRLAVQRTSERELRTKVAELEEKNRAEAIGLFDKLVEARATLREILEAYDFCSDFDSQEAEKMMDKARGMVGVSGVSNS